MRLEQLTRVSEAELKKLHGLGPRGIDLLRIALEEKGLSFAEGKRSKWVRISSGLTYLRSISWRTE